MQRVADRCARRHIDKERYPRPDQEAGIDPPVWSAPREGRWAQTRSSERRSSAAPPRCSRRQPVVGAAMAADGRRPDRR